MNHETNFVSAISDSWRQSVQSAAPARYFPHVTQNASLHLAVILDVQPERVSQGVQLYGAVNTATGLHLALATEHTSHFTLHTSHLPS
jgi:hypothetical protein